MFNFQNKIIGLFFCFLAVTAFSQKQNADKILAIVGEHIILQSEVEVQFHQMMNQSQTSGYVPTEDDKCRILDNLMLEKMFVAQANLDSVQVPEEEVQAELERRVKYFTNMMGSKEKLEEYYGKTVGELKDDFLDDVKSQLLADKMKGKVFSNMKVSPAEVKDFFAKIPKDSIPYFNSELELCEVAMFPKVSEEAKDIARKKIEKIKKDLEGGSDFSLQAIMLSEDPGSATDGGNLGLIARGELVPEFEAVAYKLPAGKVSEVVETQFGYHLILVDEKMGDKLKVRHILIKPKLTNSDVRLVEHIMDSVLHQLRVDSMTFKEAVAAFSQDENSKAVGGVMTNPKTGNQFFEKADIDGSLIFTLDRMKVGEFSEVMPFQGMEKSGEPKSGYRIIMLKSETQPHKASLATDYSKIQAATKQQKQQKTLAHWIELNKDHAYIKVDEQYQNCKLIQKWMKKAE